MGKGCTVIRPSAFNSEIVDSRVHDAHVNRKHSALPLLAVCFFMVIRYFPTGWDGQPNGALITVL